MRAFNPLISQPRSFFLFDNSKNSGRFSFFKKDCVAVRDNFMYRWFLLRRSSAFNAGFKVKDEGNLEVGLSRRSSLSVSSLEKRIYINLCSVFLSRVLFQKAMISSKRKVKNMGVNGLYTNLRRIILRETSVSKVKKADLSTRSQSKPLKTIETGEYVKNVSIHFLAKTIGLVKEKYKPFTLGSR